jgi:hypothetical protein
MSDALPPVHLLLTRQFSSFSWDTSHCAPYAAAINAATTTNKNIVSQLSRLVARDDSFCSLFDGIVDVGVDGDVAVVVVDCID